MLALMKLLREVVEAPTTRLPYNNMDVHLSMQTLNQIKDTLIEFDIPVGSRRVDVLDHYELEDIMSDRDLKLGEKLFSFTSFQHWINKARGWYRQHHVNSSNTVAIDAKDRACRIGSDFMNARDDDAYPVKVYRIE